MFDELQYFAAIVELGTFRQAAQRVHLSQPALSAAIQRLEESFGARLLHRGRSGATPTEAGKVLLPRAMAALAAIEDGRRAVEEVQGLRAGEVRLAAGATACTYLLPSILARYRDAHPGIRFLLRESTTDEAVEALDAGTMDLAIITAAGGESWWMDELILIGSPEFEVPARAGRSRFVTFRPGSTSREFQERLFPRADVVMELGSIAAVKGNVRAGIGLALVSRHAVVRDLKEGSLVEIPHRRTPVRRPLSLVHRGVERLSPAVSSLRTLLLGPHGRPDSGGSRRRR